MTQYLVPGLLIALLLTGCSRDPADASRTSSDPVIASGETLVAPAQTLTELDAARQAELDAAARALVTRTLERAMASPSDDERQRIVDDVQRELGRLRKTADAPHVGKAYLDAIDAVFDTHDKRRALRQLYRGLPPQSSFEESEGVLQAPRATDPAAASATVGRPVGPPPGASAALDSRKP